MSKISAYSELAEAPASTDEFVIVDKSDTSMAASGTTKRIQSQYVTADASTTVKGKVELATDAETITGADTTRAMTASNLTAKIDTDGTLAGNLDTRIPSQKAVKTYTAPMSEFITGWHAAGETPTYASIDSPTGVITVASGAKTKYPIGCKIKFDQSQALTSYWSFDTNSNDGVGANNGTDTSMTYTAGKFSNAATFNGTTSKIVVADASSLKPTGEFTIGGWFKTSNTGAVKSLFSSFAGLTNYAGILLEINTTNKIIFTICKNTGTSAGLDFITLSGSTTVTDNVMHNVVVTFRNNWGQVYIDGNLEASGYMFAPAYQGTNYVRIGCESYTGTDSAFMNGQLDDWYLINGYALDQDTIKARYDAGTAQGTGSITVNKKAIVTATTDTTVSAYFGTDYSLANSAITNFFYSLARTPVGFPMNKNKWTSEFNDPSIKSQATPGTGTPYNIGSARLSVPIGAWELSYKVELEGKTNSTTGNAQLDISVSLSTSSSSVDDPRMIRMHRSICYISSYNLYSQLCAYNSKNIILSTKTTFYLLGINIFGSDSALTFRNDVSPAVIRAVCAYL